MSTTHEWIVLVTPSVSDLFATPLIRCN